MFWKLEARSSKLEARLARRRQPPLRYTT